MAEKYSLAPINFSSLLKEHSTSETGLSVKIQEAMASGQLVNDELANLVVSHRLSKCDAEILGFVLDGYPKSATQLTFLEEYLGAAPSHIFVLKADFNFIKARQCGKMQDPHTLNVYHADKVSELEDDVRERLEILPSESEEVLKARYDRCIEFEKLISSKYPEVTCQIDIQHLTRTNVVEKIRFVMEKQK